jgi:DNA-directed RNA polymerase specialized sigma24 family protein
MMHDESRRAFSVPADREITGLVRRAQRHDPAAFEQIYERFADTIYLYAVYQHLPAQAAAIVAATFEQAVREIRRFNVPWRNCARRTRNWLLKIAVIQAARYNDATTAEDASTAGDDSAGRIESNPRLVAAPVAGAPRDHRAAADRAPERGGYRRDHRPAGGSGPARPGARPG